jgi:hypothetical protein
MSNIRKDIEKRLGFAAQGVKAKFADAALNQIRNNAAISDKICTLVSKGLSVPQAIDLVLGEGTYKRIGSEVYDELKKPNAKKASTDFELEDACWDGYEAVGTKKKDGKTVPNCVPKAKSNRSGSKSSFGTDSISVNKSAKSIISKLKKITPDDREEPSFGLEQFHKRLLARMNEVVKSTDEAIRNPNNANLQWTMQDLKDVIRDETGDSRTLNRWASVWLSSRPGVKVKMAADFKDRQRAAGYKWQVRYTLQLGKTDHLNNSLVIDETLAFATESAARKWADTMIKKGWYKSVIGTPEKVLTASVVPFARPGLKSKMAANDVDLWNYFANLDFNFVKQGENGLANYERFAKKALTMPDFTPPSERGNGPSLHQMAKQALADIKKYKEDLYRYKNRAPWDVYSCSGAKVK